MDGRSKSPYDHSMSFSALGFVNGMVGIGSMIGQRGLHPHSHQHPQSPTTSFGVQAFCENMATRIIVLI